MLQFRLAKSYVAGLCAAALSLAGVACYRPPVTSRPRLPEADLSRMANDALAGRAGTIIVLDPRFGNILKRFGRDADLQFASSPYELARIVTAYAALDQGAINDKTLLPCDETGPATDVISALARPCPAFFKELSRRLDPEAFTRAAGAIGFLYYGLESSGQGATAVRPIRARIPRGAGEAAGWFADLATKGVGMEARDLHFVQFVSSLASGTTASERFAAYIATTARAPAPPTERLNQGALAVVRRGLLKAVDEGEARAAASPERRVAGMSGGGDGGAIFVSYAPAGDPQVGVVVHLKGGVGRDAAEVAGKFYQTYFRKR
jgi:hypothetical protein